MKREIVPEERIATLREKMKQKVDWTDDELGRLTSDHWSFLNNMHKLRRYKMIAEVIEVTDHCELQPKIGDKYVFTASGILIQEESTFPAVCLWALAGIYPMSFMILDRILADLDPNEMWRDRVTCLDADVKHGGLGNVGFKVYCENV